MILFLLSVYSVYLTSLLKKKIPVVNLEVNSAVYSTNSYNLSCLLQWGNGIIDWEMSREVVVKCLQWQKLRNVNDITHKEWRFYQPGEAPFVILTRAFFLDLPHIWLSWKLACSSEESGWYKKFQHIPECLLRYWAKQRSISPKPRVLLNRLRLQLVWRLFLLPIPGPQMTSVSTQQHFSSLFLSFFSFFFLSSFGS